MANYSKPNITRLLNESDTAPNTAVKGAKLEELVRYIFNKVPKVSFYASNVLDGVSNAHSEILNALVRDGIRILVIKRDDILALDTTDDLVALIQRKILRLTIERTIE